MTTDHPTAIPTDPRWFLTESAQTWHVHDNGHALCRKNILPRASMRGGISQRFRDRFGLPIPTCCPCWRKLPVSADVPQDDDKRISVVYGHVRLATVDSWDAARDALRRDINQSYRNVGHSTIAARHLAELARVDAGPEAGLLVTSGPSAWASSLRYAQEGEHGLTDGDLAIVHDFTNGQARCGWTVDVKCKIVAITGHNQRVTIKITGESSQFTRGEIITVHASFLRPRTGGSR